MQEFFQKCIEEYPQWAGITAAALLIVHWFMPYHPREHFPIDDPPPKFFGSFSLGELIQFVIQVLTFPIAGFIAAYLTVCLDVPEDVGVYAFFALLILWWFIPKKLARRIDGW